ncbi:OPT oligopeptide transporter protein-domain-containing protein [Triangularia verruculosa]|uniref:OPT oligopeptide transporter protein-domain-containing protein n=1 Tax=Triangularia verruculosa TaxID=2587418 RepID=A0AAN6XJW8_9PEZI|nr:OPT oligopeptide transporter protein-domain-containing protein [Triangularia verruculosa]
MTATTEKFEAKEPVAFASVVDSEKIKLSDTNSSEQVPESLKETGRAFNVTDSDLLEAEHLASRFTLEETLHMMRQVHDQHCRDPNFPIEIINHIDQFIGNEDLIANPEKYEHLIAEMKIQAALITNNSPYAEVRAVVDNHDDPSLPVSTIRAWGMGVLFACCLSFVNSFFDIRLPGIAIGSVVVQLLAYPLGKFLERVLPDKGFTLLGVRHSLNPGPFNKKEHMLITIMSNVAKSLPYTNYIVWIQALPRYFNQAWAHNIGYQLLIALSTNFIGYGLAGMCRRFLVYPSFCVWPGSLVTIALNTAFHDEATEAKSTEGPFNTRWTITRMKYFSWALGLMTAYFFLPNYLFQALSFFSWMSWISPNNVDLAAITGTNTGLGLNPLPTLDWNILSMNIDPLMVPFFSTFNYFMGAFISMLVIVAIYYTNAFETSYLPVNSNRPFDHFGKNYNVSAIIDENGIFDAEKYKAYSPPFLAASNVAVYMFFFALYSSTVTYAALYHRLEIKLGVRDLWRKAKLGMRRWRNKNATAEDVDEDDVDLLDVHNRLMRAYPEVPEWWYMLCLAAAVAVGMVGISLWPTNTTPLVILYGIALCLVFVVPIGIIASMTGVEVTLNVIAEFIGGVWVEGNAIAMCFFKTYGYVTCAHAISFSCDLKLAHYLKIPPRFTFWAQMVPTLISTFISVAIMQYQLHIENVCTTDAPFRFSCPGTNTFFTAAVFWGTVGPRKVWGAGGRYAITLLGFPLGVVIVLVFWYLNRKWPKNAILRNTHPVVMMSGALSWAPWNLAYVWPAVPVGAISWLWLKKRHLAFWSKYNYITSAAFSCGIAVASLLIFFGLQMWGIEVKWWGNDISGIGCDANGDCVLKSLGQGEYFGPRYGEFS